MIALLILWTHALAALLFGALVFRQAQRPAGGWSNAAFVGPLVLTTLWALAVSGIDFRDVSTRIAESARTIAWLGFMFALVRRERTGNRALGAVYGTVVAIAVISALLAVVELVPMDADAQAQTESARLVFGMMVAISALVLVHHLHQAARASPDAAWHGGRLVVVAVTIMWSVDLLLAVSAYVAPRWTPVIVAVRGVAMIGMALLLLVAVTRRGDWTFAVSRRVATRSLAAIAVISYVGITAVATSVADAYGGDHARLIQTAIICGATAALFGLLATSWLRAWAKVKIAKHLFRHRYDYRAEWQRFTETLGAPGDGAAPLDGRIVKAVADLTDSPGGLLLVPDGLGMSSAAAWNWEMTTAPAPMSDRALAERLRLSPRIIELDPVRRGTAPAEESASVPHWLSACPVAWAIVPLVHGGALVGAIILARPPVDRALDWEDFDLLRVAGRQAASYLAEDRAHAALADAQRFDEFNRRFAFILHDIKNLVSQLTLVARNAERHADNPAFRVDMVATLQDSADRMNALLARLSQTHAAPSEPFQPVDVAALVNRVVGARRAQHPIAARATGQVLARAQLARLEQVLGHLIQNGIEASDRDAPIVVAVAANGATIAIDVIDQGCGMSPGFVRHQLFRPFASSKPLGFGIGAFEALQLVEAMGGSLGVFSREGEGTRFRISLPAADTMEAAA
jgi:putative PEP-CTERM system histidine kinase